MVTSAPATAAPASSLTVPISAALPICAAAIAEQATEPPSASMTAHIDRDSALTLYRTDQAFKSTYIDLFMTI
jgi:hypothetical protein